MLKSIKTLSNILLILLMLTSCATIPEEQTGTITTTGQIQKLSSITMTLKISSGSSRNDLTLDVSAIDTTMFYEGDMVAVTHTGVKVSAISKLNTAQTEPAREETSANIISTNSSISSTTYTSTEDNENALLIDNARVSFSSITVAKNEGYSVSSAAGDAYGANAALLARNKANVAIKDSTIMSSVKNGNGIFSYGAGTSVSISDSVIMTTGSSSAGLQATSGAAITADNLTVTTFGSSSAAVRSSRGGGNVNVTGGSYITSGHDSPAVYAAGNMTITGATLTARGSEAIIVDGGSSLTVSSSDIHGSMSAADGNAHTIMIYQSESGVAEAGTSTLTISGGTLTGESGEAYLHNQYRCYRHTLRS